MKKLLLLAAALCVGLSTQAKTNTPTPETDTAQNNFGVTALAWGTSIDYTKAYPTNGIAFSIGALWENNVSWANYIDASKNFGKFVAIAEMGNAGVAGTIERGQLGIGYELFRQGDLRLIAAVSPGYQRQTLQSAEVGHGTYVQPMITAQKLMAHGAFAEIGLGYDVYVKGKQPNYPLLKIGTGFTF